LLIGEICLVQSKVAKVHMVVAIVTGSLIPENALSLVIMTI